MQNIKLFVNNFTGLIRQSATFGDRQETGIPISTNPNGLVERAAALLVDLDKCEKGPAATAGGRAGKNGTFWHGPRWPARPRRAETFGNRLPCPADTRLHPQKRQVMPIVQRPIKNKRIRICNFLALIGTVSAGLDLGKPNRDPIYGKSPDEQVLSRPRHAKTAVPRPSKLVGDVALQ
jgi:hypothetical protein